MFNDSKCKCAWVSPIYKQSKKVFEEMVLAFEGTGVIKSNASELTITTTNGSTLQFFSAERYDNIRGFTFDYLVCDEFAFMDEQAWTEVLRATVLVKGKKVLLISTPKGKNHFWNIYNLQDVNDKYQSFTETSYNGLASKKEIDDARFTLPDHVFRQEYLAEFIDGGASLFLNLQTNDKPEKTSRYYAGVDVGRADDYTVLSIFNDKGQMVLIDRWRQMDWATIVRLMANKIKEYQADTLIEVNSIGDAVYEMLLNELGNSAMLSPFVTTSKSKQDIIEQMIVSNQNKEFSILPESWLLNEFNVFTYDWNPKTRSIRYSAPNGFHDDGVMSTAIGYQSYKVNCKLGWTTTIR